MDDTGPRIRRLFMGRFGYTVGMHDVTDIKFGETAGQMAYVRTVEVYKNGHIHFEIPYARCEGVEYFPPDKECNHG